MAVYCSTCLRGEARRSEKSFEKHYEEEIDMAKLLPDSASASAHADLRKLREDMRNRKFAWGLAISRMIIAYDLRRTLKKLMMITY